MPSPGGEGAVRSKADEVEILRSCQKRQKAGHLISRLRRQIPLKGKPLGRENDAIPVGAAIVSRETWVTQREERWVTVFGCGD